MEKALYICDPSKNTQCKKTYCASNGGECRLTNRIEFAYTFNDKPMIAMKHVIGFKTRREEHEKNTVG